MRCFIDTNTLIHFKLFSEIDWVKELQFDKVELAICTTVLSELDNKKFSEPDIDIRNRCHRIIDALSSYVDKSDIRENVSLIFIKSEPQVDWEGCGLSREVPDDRILGAIIIDQEAHCLITADLGLRLKASTKGICTKQLSDNLRVKIKVDKKDAVIRRLQEEVQKYQSRLPDLDLLLLEGELQQTHAKHTINRVKPYCPEDTEAIIEKERRILEYIPVKKDINPLVTSFIGFIEPDADEIARYERDVTKYLSKLREYYANSWKRMDAQSRFYSISLILINSGTAPADDIDVILHLPDGFEVIKKNPFESEIAKPERPIRPRSLAEKMASVEMPNPFPVYNLGSHYNRGIGLEKPNISGPEIKKTNSFDVSFKVQRLKHNMHEKIGPLFIYFLNYDDVKSFSFEYRILIANHPEEKKGILNLIFTLALDS